MTCLSVCLYFIGMVIEKPTTAELKAAFLRAGRLRFMGWSFEQTIAVPVMLKVLQMSALAHRRDQVRADQASFNF